MADNLSSDELRELFDHAHGRCQCRMPHCNHSGQCAAEFPWDEYGRAWDLADVMQDAFPETDPFRYFIFCSDCARRWQRLKPPQPRPT